MSNNNDLNIPSNQNPIDSPSQTSKNIIPEESGSNESKNTENISNPGQVDKFSDQTQQSEHDKKVTQQEVPTTSSQTQAVMSAEPIPEKKQKSKFKIACLIILALFALLTLCCLITGVIYLRNNHIPVISPYVEDLFVPAEEQLAGRLDLLLDGLAYNIISNADEETSPLETDITEDDLNKLVVANYAKFQESMERSGFDSNISLAFKLDNGVLGDSFDPGEITEKDILKILESDQGELNLNISGQMDMSVEEELKSKVDVGFSYSSPGIRLSTAVKLLILQEDVYFLLDYFPKNPWLLTEPIEDKWLHYKLDGLSTEEITSIPILPVYDFGSIVPNNGYPSYNKIDLERTKQLFRSAPIARNVSKLPDEVIGKNDTKCYQVALEKDDIIDLVLEASTIWKVEDAPSREELEESSEVADNIPVTIALCFGKNDSIPYKVSFSTETKTGDIMYDIALEYKIWQLEAKDKIEAPSDEITEFEDVDWEEVLTPLMESYTGLYNPYQSDIDVCTLSPESKGCIDCETNGNESELCVSCNTKLNAFFESGEFDYEDDSFFNNCAPDQP